MEDLSIWDDARKLYAKFRDIIDPLEKEIEKIEAAQLPVLLRLRLPSEIIKIFIADIANRQRQTGDSLENSEAIVLSVCMRYAMLLDAIWLEDRRDFMPNLLLYIHQLITKKFDVEQQDIRTIPALAIEKVLPIIEYFESLARERGCLDIRRTIERIGTKIFGQIQLHQ